MKLEHVVALAVRLFAVVVGLYALRNGLVVGAFYLEQGKQAITVSYAAGMLFTILVAVVLWRFPMTIARRLVTFREPGESDVSSANVEQLQSVGFTILGLYLLFYVLSGKPGQI